MTTEETQAGVDLNSASWQVGKEVHDDSRMQELAKLSTQGILMRDDLDREDPEKFTTFIKSGNQVLELDVKIAPGTLKTNKEKIVMVRDYDQQTGKEVVGFAKITKLPDYRMVCEPVADDEQTKIQAQISAALKGEGVMPVVYPLGIIKSDTPDAAPQAMFVMSEKIISSDVEGVIK